MANLDYRQKKKIQIYAVAILLLVCCVVLSACSQDRGVFDVSGETIAEPTHFMAKFMLMLGENIGNFGWTVVVFTVVLRLILMPVDFWQKMVARKNQKAMKRMKPELEVLAKKYGDDKQKYQQEQMALYKKHKYSMMGACLPTILTMVVFLVVFAGFREMVGYQFALDYKSSYNVFHDVVEEELESAFPESAYASFYKDGKIDLALITPNADNAAVINSATSKAQSAVKENYYSEEETSKREFLWIKNIFVGDNWKKSVPDYLTVTGQEGFVTARLEGVMIDEYNQVMDDVLNTGGWGKNGKWNGWLLLPILSVLLTFVSTKLLSSQQAQPPMPTPTKDDKDGKDGKAKNAGGMQGSMKAMQYMMPLITGVFGLLYSSAFALYMFVSSFVAIAFQTSFTLVAKIVDVSREKKAGTYVPKTRSKNGKINRN